MLPPSVLATALQGSIPQDVLQPTSLAAVSRASAGIQRKLLRGRFPEPEGDQQAAGDLLHEWFIGRQIGKEVLCDSILD
jgi:hypothetical protein